MKATVSSTSQAARTGPVAAVLHRRSSESEVRIVLGRAMAAVRLSLIAVAIFSFVGNTLILAIPIYLFQISDRVLTSRSLDTLTMLTAVILGAVVVYVVVDIVRRLILMRIAVELEGRLGPPVLAAAARASQNGSSREFQVLGDLQHLRNFITGPVLLTMLDAPVAPLYMAAVFLVHPYLGLIVAATGALLLLIALLNQHLTAQPFAESSVYSMRATLQTDAMARNAGVLNAMGMVPEAARIWGRETRQSLGAHLVAQDRNILLAGLSRLIRLFTQIALLGFGAWLALSGDLTGGMTIAASIVASRALAPIEGTIEGWRSFVAARTALRRIRSLLQQSPLNLEKLRLPAPKGALTVERVLYVPPPEKNVVLNGISFALEAGESLAIVGASGAGKSTLARMLVGSVFPTAGSIRLDMMDLRNWDRRQFGENIGFLPQDVQLFPATIKENIARLRPDATDHAVYSAAEIAGIHEMVSHFQYGYETPITMDGSPLSGGQKQRVGLARAFFGDPKLVVLDEPNSNLDSAGEVALAQALARAKTRGITVVAITQRPALLRAVDRIMLLNNGTVQALGKREDILPKLWGDRVAAVAPGPMPVANRVS